MDNSFSLIHEPWIPITGCGRKSLIEVFSYPYSSLSGTPIEQLSIFKLLLALVQSAITPKNEEEWLALGSTCLAKTTLEYLKKYEDNFYLYGSTPFLQMRQVEQLPTKPFAVVVPEIASGNTTVLTQSQTNRKFSDAEIAVQLVTMQNFAFGGKKTDNSFVLTKGYKGKTKSGKPGCSLEKTGLLHTYVQGKDIWETLWLNLWTEELISNEKVKKLFPEGKGLAPWEKMPEGEDCETATKLRGSLLGRLVPLCRFCLIKNQDVHLTEGIQYGTSKDGFVDTTASITLGDKTYALLVNPSKRPWRELTAILSTIQSNPTVYCAQLSVFYNHCQTLLKAFPDAYSKEVFFWSGGIRVSNKAGEQYTSASDDYIESIFKLSLRELCEPGWYILFSAEMKWLNTQAKKLEKCIKSYCEDLKLNIEISKVGTNDFWTQTELLCQEIIDACAQEDPSQQAEFLDKVHRKVYAISADVYSNLCSNSTSKQLMSWAKFHPNFSSLRKKGNLLYER